MITATATTNPSAELGGQTAPFTGATPGIGKAAALTLAEHGELSGE
jgi:deazaflavin-dependent oxidoreductase (nitroreductase family)